MNSESFNRKSSQISHQLPTGGQQYKKGCINSFNFIFCFSQILLSCFYWWLWLPSYKITALVVHMATLIRMEWVKHRVPEAVMWWVQWLLTTFSVRAKFRDIFIVFRARSEIFCRSHSYTWTHDVDQLLLVTRVMTESGCHQHPKHRTTTFLPIISIPLCQTWPTLSTP
jgi:hypothetical protein